MLSFLRNSPQPFQHSFPVELHERRLGIAATDSKLVLCVARCGKSFFRTVVPDGQRNM